MKVKLPKGEVKRLVIFPKPKCTFCGEEIVEVPKDPIFWLYQLIRTRKMPEGKIWVHNRTDSEWCRLSKAIPTNQIELWNWNGDWKVKK